MNRSAVRSILVVDDEPDVLRGLELVLTRGGDAFRGVSSGEEALATLEAESFDLVITDLQMPGFQGQELVAELIRRWPELPVVVLTATGAISTAVELMRTGVADYLMKPIDPEELLIRIERVLQFREFQAAFRAQKSAYGRMVGEDPKMRKVFETIERVAQNTAPVLIRGEPGTGKELVADAIHRRRIEFLRERAESGSETFEIDDHPFVPVNCGAFTRELLSSQLFGHKRGAFTGADRDQEGVFVAARHGTLFLDEITEIPPELQVMLLRAIQEKEVVPIGSNVPVPTPARLITATNRPLQELVESGRFRQDLYFRIQVVEILLPPLRERRGDIPLLARSFVEEIARGNGQAPKQLTPDVLEAFHAYPWPGNVRELHNAVEHALALGRHTARIGLADLPAGIREALRTGVASGGGTSVSTAEGFPSLDALLRRHCVESLRRTRGVITRAARLLDIDRNRLSRLIRKYQIEEEEWESPSTSATK